MEKLQFTLDDGSIEEFYVEEQTTVGGVTYLLVSDSQEDEANVYIMKETSDPENETACYEMVEDPQEMKMIYDIFSLMLMYLSAIFYYIDQFPQNIQNLFMLNPLYCYISYFRTIVIDGTIPTLNHHLLALLYAVLFLFAGGMIYHKKNQQFLYYM